MSFNPIDSAEITSGKPLSSATGQKIKDNFQDHEDRLEAIEGGTATTFPPLTFRINGPYGDFGAVNSILKTTVNFPMTILGVRILIDKAGTTGITQIDLKVKSGVGSYVSTLLTQPSVSYTAGDDALSTNGVVDPAHCNLLAGDILRLDLTSVQAGGDGFTVRIDYSRTP